MTSVPRPSGEDLRRRWELVLPYRPSLLALARRRAATPQDAEDAVATALLRAVEHPALDEARVGAFLNTAVVRLTVDQHRRRARHDAATARDAARTVPVAPFDETVCDRDEARWLARRLADAPARELQVLRARTAGLTPDQTAAALGLTPKAAGNAYTRLRHRAAALVASTLAIAGLAAAAVRRAARPAAVAAAPAFALLAAGTALPPPPDAHARPPSPPAAAQPVSGATAGLHPADGTAARPSGDLPATTTPATVPKQDRAAPHAAPPAAPAPRRTYLLPPQAVAGGAVGGPAVYTEQRESGGTFQEEVQHCLDNTPRLLADPTADPCA